MTARIHHYVPKLYLRGFSCDRRRRKVCVVDGFEQTVFTTNIHNVAAERDFNRIDVAGIEPDKLETDLSEFETKVAAAITRTCQQANFQDAEDRRLIFNLICLMAVRNPRHRNSLNDFQGRIAKMIMDQTLATPERWNSQIAQAKEAGYMAMDADATYDKMKAFHESGNYKVELRREAHLALELSVHDEILPYIAERKWTLLHAPPDEGQFITSDHPVCLVFTDPEIQRPTPIGFGLANTEVLFPLTADFALLGTFECEERKLDADIITIANCNAAVIAHAERQVYASSPDFPYLSRGRMLFARGEECLTDGTFIRPRQEPTEEEAHA
jgi:hypothetical protein